MAYLKKGQKPLKNRGEYSPFGLKHKGYNTQINGRHHKFMFGGKELQDDIVGGSSLDWYDVSARNYDPALGRWMNLDPLAESMTRHSPYNYAFDNPIFFNDPDGMAPVENNFLRDFKLPSPIAERIESTYVNDEGVIIKHIDDDDPNIYLVLNPENGLNKSWIIGKERDGENYDEGGFINSKDLKDIYNTSPRGLPEGFKVIKDKEEGPELTFGNFLKEVIKEAVGASGSGIKPKCSECPPENAGTGFGNQGHNGYRLSVELQHRLYHKKVKKKKVNENSVNNSGRRDEEED